MLKTQFDYTDSLSAWGSSAVSEAYFDAKRNAVAVVLSSGDVYEYTNFTQDNFNAFKGSLSKGRFYAKTVKPQFGPGEYLGDVYDVAFTVPAPAMDAVGTPKGLDYAKDAVVDGKPNVFDLTTAAPVSPVATRKHTVSFVVGDSTDVKTYDAVAGSVDEAAEAVTTLGEALDLDFRVKGVYVSFE